MTDIEDDPFAPKTAEPAPEKEGVLTEVKTGRVSKATSDGKLVTTLKGGSSFTDPWIVLHAESLEETEEFFSKANANRLAALMERVQNAGKHFVTLGGGPAPATSAPAQARSAVPAEAQSAPDGDSRQCRHGEMQYKTGSKNGRTWKGFFCPTPKDTPGQCSPEFLR